MDDEDLELLRFEKRLWRYAGAKATAIREQFGLTEVAYYQRLHAICDRAEALAAEPMVVNRVNRRRGAFSGTAQGPSSAPNRAGVT